VQPRSSLGPLVKVRRKSDERFHIYPFVLRGRQNPKEISPKVYPTTLDNSMKGPGQRKTDGGPAKNANKGKELSDRTRICPERAQQRQSRASREMCYGVQAKLFFSNGAQKKTRRR